MAEINIKSVARRFGKVEALKSIDLTVADQEFLVLLGASGCGKTTLLRIVAGLESASEGEVWIGDKRVDKLPPRERNIAMVFQNYAVFPHLTVYENIAFGLRMAKLSQEIVDDRVTRTAKLMHIDPLLQRYSGQLSGGQRQRVAVARALAMEPEVLLMDEPLSNLDALLRMEMRAELKSVLATSKTTTIYVTHDQVEAMSMADRIAIMNKGEIVQASDAVDIYRNPAHRFVGSFIGNPPMNFIPATPGENSNWTVAGVQFPGPNPSDMAGANIEFAIRPEDLNLANEHDTSALKATVRIVEPLGSHVLASCLVDEHLFRVVLDSDHPVTEGDTLNVKPMMDRIRWFDSNTERSL